VGLFFNAKKSILTFLIPQLPRIHNLVCYNITPPLHQSGYLKCGYSTLEARWACRCNSAKHYVLTNDKLKIHVKQLRSINCPNMHLRAPFARFGIIIMPMKNPMVHSLSSTLGSSICDELASQIMFNLAFQNA
jgi:hypothetical protein